jgi:hypothetical protein
MYTIHYSHEHIDRAMAMLWAKKIFLWNTLFFIVKVRKKMTRNLRWKNKISGKEIAESFSSTIQTLFILEIWPKMSLGLSISRTVVLLFSIFIQIIIKICMVTWWLGHNLTTKNLDNAKGSSYSRAFWLQYKSALRFIFDVRDHVKKIMTRRKMTADPAVAIFIYRCD